VGLKKEKQYLYFLVDCKPNVSIPYTTRTYYYIGVIFKGSSSSTTFKIPLFILDSSKYKSPHDISIIQLGVMDSALSHNTSIEEAFREFSDYKIRCPWGTVKL